MDLLFPYQLSTQKALDNRELALLFVLSAMIDGSCKFKSHHYVVPALLDCPSLVFLFDWQVSSSWTAERYVLFQLIIVREVHNSKTY